MKIYIDLFFLFNLIMDIIIIIGTSIILKRKTTIFRMIISSFIGGLSSLLLFFNISKIIIEIIGVLVMSIVCFKYKNIKYTLKNILYMYILSILLGGIIYLFNIKVSTNIYLSYLIIIIISIETIFLYIKEIKNIKNNYNNYYNVDIYFKDNTKLSLIGFLDTGNNLYDQYKHRPVIIVSNKYIIKDNYILVVYRSVNGDGLIKCVKPYKVLINNSVCKKDVLIGFSKVKLIEGVDVILHKDVMKGEI